MSNGGHAPERNSLASDGTFTFVFVFVFIISPYP
jgi:hypothetical protein